MPADNTRDFSVLADELLAAWDTGQTIPDLSVLLRGSGTLSPEDVAELCLTDQPFRWRTAEPLRVEDYLALCPAMAQQPELVLELAYGEIRTRQQLGDPPSAEEIEARFPDLAPRLHEQLQVGFWLDAGAASESPAIPFRPICAVHQSGRFGPYELGEAIAHGGMGIVFRARHVSLNRVVALKMIRPDRITRDVDHRRFHNETVTIAQLDHPHIVPIYDVGEVDGVHYFTMKLMEGGDLQQQCRRYLEDPQAAASVMMQVAEAVHHAHQCGVLHRDVKPSNILLDHAGTPFVTDFGLARRLDDNAELTQSRDLMGTPAYLAPEQLAPDQGPLTIAADVYGLGAVLYVLLTGKPPFEAEHLIAMLESIRNREPASPCRLNPRVDPDLEQVCLKALAKRPADRYASARELADDLQRFLAGGGVQARPLPWWQRRWRWVRRHPDLAVIGAVILATAAVLLTLLGLQTVRLQNARALADRALETASQTEIQAQGDRREAERLRTSAERLQSRAEQANSAAETARAEAATARAEAFTQRGIARQTAYAAAIHYLDLARKEGDITEFSRLLDEQLPGAGQPDVRGFEWFVLDRLYRPRPARFPVLRGPVRSLCYSPDSRRLAAAGEAGVIQILDAETGRVLAFWPSLTTTRGLAFSPDGKLLAAVGDDGQVRVFPAGGQPKAWPVAKQPVWQVAFVGNGPSLATLDQEGNIRIVDHGRGEIVATLSGVAGVVESIAVAPDGTWLISGDRDGLFVVWDLATRQAVYRFAQDAKQKIKCLAVSADGTLVASGSTDNRVRVIRLHRPWRHQWILFGQHFDRLESVAFSADGRRVAGCDKGGAVRVWQLPSNPEGDKALELPPSPPEHAWQAHQGRGYALAYHPQQARIASGGQENHVAVWKVRSRLESLSLGTTGAKWYQDHSLVFTPDGNTLAATAEDGVQLWNLRTRRLTSRLSRNTEPRDHLAISRDGRYLAAARKSQRLIEVWQMTPQGYQFLWETRQQACDHLAFSPQAGHLAVTNWDGDEIVVYDSLTADVERRIPAQQCWAGEFSPEGRQFAFSELDDVVVWDWTGRQPLRRLRGHQSTVTGIAFSPDGRRLASCGNDRRIIVWDAQSGEPLRTLTGHRDEILQVVFVGNDRLVSLGKDSVIFVWNVGYSVPLCTLREPDGRFCSRLAVSPDQQWLAWRLSDGEIPLLDLSVGDPEPQAGDAATAVRGLATQASSSAANPAKHSSQ